MQMLMPMLCLTWKSAKMEICYVLLFCDPMQDAILNVTGTFCHKLEENF